MGQAPLPLAPVKVYVPSQPPELYPWVLGLSFLEVVAYITLPQQAWASVLRRPCNYKQVQPGLCLCVRIPIFGLPYPYLLRRKIGSLWPYERPCGAARERCSH